MTEGQGDQAGKGTLRRLLSARRQAVTGQGHVPPLPQPSAPTPARAAAIAASRAADRLYGMATQAVSVQAGAVTLAELPELLPEKAVMAVLQGPRDAIGVAALCPETVAALTEIQTIGRVTARPIGHRTPTRSDGLICAEFVNALMAELAQDMADLDGFDAVRGYRYASFLDHPQPLTLMLEDRPMRSLSLTLRFGGPDGRLATIFIAFPQPRTRSESNLPSTVHPAKALTEQTGRSDVRPRHDVVVARTLNAAMQDAPVDVFGVLCRRTISLKELRALAPDRVLSLPRASLSDARLETHDGQILCLGKFGEAAGCHALRLRNPGDAGISMLPAGRAIVPAEPPITDLTTPDPFRTGVNGLSAAGP